jgi:hypothetical protein
MTHETINDQWKSFSAALKLDRPGVPEVQRSEMKRAFFGGFTAALAKMKRIGDVMPMDQGAAMLERYWQECRGFNEAVQMGGA